MFKKNFSLAILCTCFSIEAFSAEYFWTEYQFNCKLTGDQRDLSTAKTPLKPLEYGAKMHILVERNGNIQEFDYVGHTQSKVSSGPTNYWSHPILIEPVMRQKDLSFTFSLEEYFGIKHNITLKKNFTSTDYKTYYGNLAADFQSFETYNTILKAMHASSIPNDSLQARIAGALQSQRSETYVNVGPNQFYTNGEVQIHYPREQYNGLSYHIRQECSFTRTKLSDNPLQFELPVIPTLNVDHNNYSFPYLCETRAYLPTTYQHSLNQVALSFGIELSDDEYMLKRQCSELFSDLTESLELHLTNKKISDTRIFKFAKNLAILNLEGNNISDITPLFSLKNLRQLNLKNNKISNIKNISSLKNLLELDISENPITDYKPLCVDRFGINLDILEGPVGITQICR